MFTVASSEVIPAGEVKVIILAPPARQLTVASTVQPAVRVTVPVAVTVGDVRVVVTFTVLKKRPSLW
jgi:hypothetical protein